jgi:hypothetical protein
MGGGLASKCDSLQLEGKKITQTTTHYRTGQDRTGQDRTGQYSTVQYRIVTVGTTDY